MDPKLRDEKGA